MLNNRTGVRRIAVLMGLAESDPQYQRYVSAFTQGLRDLGWVEGRNVRIDYRAAGGDYSRAQALAKELRALKPDLIVPHTDMSVEAFRGETRSIPMVFVSTADPVTAGYVASYAHPGGITTGFTCCAEFSLAGKWLELLKEVVPSIGRVAKDCRAESNRLGPTGWVSISDQFQKAGLKPRPGETFLQQLLKIHAAVSW